MLKVYVETTSRVVVLLTGLTHRHHRDGGFAGTFTAKDFDNLTLRIAWTNERAIFKATPADEEVQNSGSRVDVGDSKGWLDDYVFEIDALFHNLAPLIEFGMPTYSILSHTPPPT